MKKRFLIFTLFIATYQMMAQSLQPGDIAFIGYQSTFPQAFAFVATRDIAPDEVIYITDQGLKDKDGHWGELIETHLEFTVPETGLGKGDIVSIEHSGIENDKSQLYATSGSVMVHGLPTFMLHIFGDQLIAYQADSLMAEDARFIAAIHTNSIRNEAYSSWSSYYMSDLPIYSFMPAGLENGLNCISIYPNNAGKIRLRPKNNAKYSGKSLNLKEINDKSNWVTSNNQLDISPCGFNISKVCNEDDNNHDLLFFEARKQGVNVKLMWVDFDSLSRHSYVVEKSKDGYNWYSTDLVKEVINAEMTNCYAFYDQNPQDGLSYYRLRIMGSHGQYSFSETKPVLLHGDR